MSKKSIILSAAGLKNVVTNKESEEFIFKIGEKELKMNRIFAEFISPTVSHIHHSDPTINFINLSEFVNRKKFSHKINAIFEDLLNDYFLAQILNLSEGNSIEIENDQIIKSIRYFSILVNNEELFNKINELETTNKNDDKNINELLEEIEFLYEMNPTFNGHRYSKLIDDISSKISKSESKEMNLKKVTKCILYLILNNEHFQIEDVDSIFDLINEIFSIDSNEDEEYDIKKFYELIDINKLSKRKFEEYLSKLDYRELTSDLWSKLCEILVNHKEENKNQETKENKNKNGVLKFEFDGKAFHRFNGIIRHLQGSEKTNICDRGIINVTASTCNMDYPTKNAVDFDGNNYFLSGYKDDWLKYDFKEKKIRPISYSIKASNEDDYYNPINWFIEVSNTDIDDDWRIIDSRKGVTSVSKCNQSDTFDISTRLSDNEYYRYIRFRCDGDTSEGCTWLAISSLEYFGYLIE